MLQRNTITQEYLKSILNYDADTGIFTWKIKKARCVKIGSIAGTLEKDGYIRIRINNTAYPAHRLAFLYINGWVPNEIDHINLKKSDNRICNLRNANKKNQQNVGIQKNNTSGYKGVNFHRTLGKWQAHIGNNGKVIHLGTFTTKEEAAVAYEKAAEKYHGHFARLS